MKKPVSNQAFKA